MNITLKKHIRTICAMTIFVATCFAFVFIPHLTEICLLSAAGALFYGIVYSVVNPSEDTDDYRSDF